MNVELIESLMVISWFWGAFWGGKVSKSSWQERESENANPIASAEPYTLLESGHLWRNVVSLYLELIVRWGSIWYLGKESKLLNYLYSLSFFHLASYNQQAVPNHIVFLSFLCHNCQNKYSLEKDEKKASSWDFSNKKKKYRSFFIQSH